MALSLPWVLSTELGRAFGRETNALAYCEAYAAVAEGETAVPMLSAFVA